MFMEPSRAGRKTEGLIGSAARYAETKKFTLTIFPD